MLKLIQKLAFLKKKKRERESYELQPAIERGFSIGWLQQPVLSTVTIPWGAPGVKGPSQVRIMNSPHFLVLDTDGASAS